uniref:Uncharacterized protein n=1 Tax=Arundo donax TaxID=35708 RepID=A0A0A9C0W2_ARUDO
MFSPPHRSQDITLLSSCAPCLRRVRSSSPSSKDQCSIHELIGKNDCWIMGHFITETCIIPCFPDTPTHRRHAYEDKPPSSRPHTCNPLSEHILDILWQSATRPRLKVQVMMLQRKLPSGHLKNRWSSDSSPPRKQQLLSPFHFLLRILSLVNTLLLSSNQRKILTLSGILIFQMNFQGYSSCWQVERTTMMS